jgi:hypothetical protein
MGAILIAALGGPALAQGNPIIGTWVRDAGGGVAVKVIFGADGRAQIRHSGGGFIQLQYRVTGPNRVEYRGVGSLVCPGNAFDVSYDLTKCSQGITEPTFGDFKSEPFSITGRQLQFLGFTFTRS